MAKTREGLEVFACSMAKKTFEGIAPENLEVFACSMAKKTFEGIAPEDLNIIKTAS